jgi:hypothetical protein
MTQRRIDSEESPPTDPLPRTVQNYPSGDVSHANSEALEKFVREQVGDMHAFWKGADRFPDYTHLARNSRGEWFPVGDGGLPPLTAAAKVLAVVFPRKYYERVLKPTILDAQQEYLEAKAASSAGQALWVLLRAYLIIGKTAFSVVGAPLVAALSVLRKLTHLLGLF